MGDVGPKIETNLGVRGAREYFILLVLERLSRKLDASCTVEHFGGGENGV